MGAIKIIFAVLIVVAIILAVVYWKDISKLWTKQSRPGPRPRPLPPSPVVPANVVFPSDGILPGPVTPDVVFPSDGILPQPVTPIPEPTPAPDSGENTGQELSPEPAAPLIPLDILFPSGGLIPRPRPMPAMKCSECGSPELVYCPNAMLPANIRSSNTAGLLLSKYRLPEYDPPTPNAMVNGQGYYIRQGTNGCS